MLHASSGEVVPQSYECLTEEEIQGLVDEAGQKLGINATFGKAFS